jgi:NAD-dependent DNA ligase
MEEDPLLHITKIINRERKENNHEKPKISKTKKVQQVLELNENITVLPEKIKKSRSKKVNPVLENPEEKTKKPRKPRTKKVKLVINEEPINQEMPILPKNKTIKLKIREPKGKVELEETNYLPIVPILSEKINELPMEALTTTLPKRKLTLKIKQKPDQITDQPPLEKPLENDIKIKHDNKTIRVLDIPKMTTQINNFKEQGITVLEALSESEIVNMLKFASDKYYNDNVSLLTDNEYDIIKEYLENKNSKNAFLKTVGAPITKNKVTLPYNMPSMDKIKPDTNALTKYVAKYKGSYVLSCKLDGVSGMYSTEAGSLKLYTRGDGTVGQDITHLLPALRLPNEQNIVVRGEFIMQRGVFEDKYAGRFANPRNLVSGIINSKTIDEKTADLHFVAYEVIQPVMKPSEQLAKLTEWGFEVVRNETVVELTNELLSEKLIDWRTNYEYEIDGIIVTNDKLYQRIEGNPEHAFAFKMVISDQLAEAKVVDVIWTASKSGYLKPRVRIEPIRLGGVTIEYATGFNGAFIETNKIGIGAVIQIIRSGDVIPHIKSVTTPAERAKMPLVPYHWTETHVDIILDNIGEDADVREKNITAFFTGLEVDGLSSGNVKRIIRAGFNTIPAILKMTREDFEKVEGFGAKMIDKVFLGIAEKVKSASLIDIMAVSNMFGRGIGERKMKPIMSAFPDILTRPETVEQKIVMLRTIPGIGPENAKSFAEHISVFMDFLKECDLDYKLNAKSSVELANTMVPAIIDMDITHPLYQKHVVMTKVRDATIIDGLKRVGGFLDDNMGRNTFALIVKSKTDVSNKTKYADEHGIPTYIPAEFIAKYF